MQVSVDVAGFGSDTYGQLLGALQHIIDVACERTGMDTFLDFTLYIFFVIFATTWPSTAL